MNDPVHTISTFTACGELKAWAMENADALAARPDVKALRQQYTKRMKCLAAACPVAVGVVDAGVCEMCDGRFRGWKRERVRR